MDYLWSLQFDNVLFQVRMVHSSSQQGKKLVTREDKKKMKENVE